MSKDDWLSVSRNKPCPVCDKPDNCKVSPDGSAAWCGRISEGSVRQNNGGQFLHILRDRRDAIDWRRRNPKSKVEPSPKSKSSKDWERVAHAAFCHPNAGAKRCELGVLLGVDVTPLERLSVGWVGHPNTSYWSFPERDATGRIIGINRRFRDGKKRNLGPRGLTFDPDGWMHSDADPEHIYLVEGGSDTATLLTLGLAAVGRPSNVGGVNFLVELLRPVPKDQIIVVVGEQDRKLHESLPQSQRARHKPDCAGCSVCWPGWYGATRTAEQLAIQLNRRIAWTFPPNGAKDAREWLNRVERTT